MPLESFTCRVDEQDSQRCPVYKCTGDGCSMQAAGGIPSDSSRCQPAMFGLHKRMKLREMVIGHLQLTYVHVCKG